MLWVQFCPELQWFLETSTIFPRIVSAELFGLLKAWKSHIVSTLSFLLCKVYIFWELLRICKLSEKATKFCQISASLLSNVVPVKCMGEILQNFVAFSEHMNFNEKETIHDDRKMKKESYGLMASKNQMWLQEQIDFTLEGLPWLEIWRKQLSMASPLA